MSKHHTSRKVTIKKLGGPPEREKLEKVYRAVLLNFAVGNSDIERITGFESSEVRRLTKNLARTGLLEGSHVNSERTITWQTWYDIENDKDAERDGMLAFNRTFEEFEPEEPTAPVNKTGGGPRYTAEQIDQAAALREQGTSWKTIAAEVGVKSPFHFSKVVRSSREGVR